MGTYANNMLFSTSFNSLSGYACLLCVALFVAADAAGSPAARAFKTAFSTKYKRNNPSANRSQVRNKTDRAMRTRTMHLQRGMEIKQNDSRCMTHLYTYVIDVKTGEYESYDLANSGLPRSFITNSPTLVHMNLEADLGVCNCHRCRTYRKTHQGQNWWQRLGAFWHNTLFLKGGLKFSESD